MTEARATTRVGPATSFAVTERLADGARGLGHTGPATSFALTARLLADRARALGLIVPAFRSPPRMVGVDRTVRRRGGHVTVSVRSRDRPWPSVVADMIEGVVVANDLVPAHAGRVRADLWDAVTRAAEAAA
jgi:hypothetical protein